MKYVYSIKSHRNTAHVSNCPYARIIGKDNRRFIESSESLQNSKRHLCRCCPTVIRGKLRRESAQVRGFLTDSRFSVALKNERMEITSPLGSWLLIPNKDGIGMRLYHANYMVGKKEWSPVPGYHLQKAKSYTVMGFLKYIREHDDYKLQMQTRYFEDRARRAYQRTQPKSITSKYGSIETELPVKRSGKHGGRLTRNDRRENDRFTRAQLTDYYCFLDSECA